MWCEAGFDPSTFWRQSPRSFDAAISGYARRRDIERDQLLLGAWMTAALTRAKKMPTLDRLLNRTSSAPAEAQDAEEMLAALRTWAEIQNGGPHVQ